MQKKLNKKVKLIVMFAGLIIGYMSCISSCKKFVHVDAPITQLVSSTVFQSDETAASAISGIYGDMISSGGFASGDNYSVTVLTGFSSDELLNYSSDGNQIQFYQNALSRENVLIKPQLWAPAYKYIFAANSIIEGVSSSGQISIAAKKQLKGEALFIRAFCNFYLTNLFGDVPLILTSDYSLNAIAPRAPVDQVFLQIISDLKEVKNELAADYSASNGERVRPNKWAATALLARAYLYTKDWPDAEEEATAVINNTDLYSLVPNLNDVFLENSNEAIWQLKPVTPGLNTYEGFNFILNSDPNSQALSDALVKAFELNDLRRRNWVDSVSVSGQTFYYPYKYKVQSSPVVTEYSMVLRVAEQYLIRAEARARQNEIADAKSDVDKIRNRASLVNTTATDETTLIEAILQERRVELFTEWGHRWSDLRRMGQADSVLGPVKPHWKSTAIFYPIPQSEIQNDSRLTQNDGY